MLMGNISVAKGFQTAVNIAYDLNNDNKLNGFIPTQSSLEIIEDILLSTSATATQRARILIGAYGRGKSHIILVLLSLLAGRDKKLFKALLAKMKKCNPALHDYTTEYLKSGRRLLPVVVRGSSTSLTSSFLSALQLTLNDEGLADVMPETHFQAAINTIASWKKDFPKTYKKLESLLPRAISEFVISLKEYDVTAYEQFIEIYPQLTSGSAFNPFLGFDIVELYENVAKSVKERGYDGIFVVYDEFSKYLESSIANATISDIKLLQDFAEKCDRSGNLQIHLLLICHKDIANYIDDGLPKEKVDGWRGVSGRFKHINLHNNYAQMYDIISDVITKKQIFWDKFKKDNQIKFNDLIKRFVANGLLNKNDINEIEHCVYGCYPLHPISTFILPRLSERVAQNERTLFTFLSAEDKFTLPSFLSTQFQKENFPLLTPDYIYDYFEPLLRKEPYTSETHRIYKLTTNVLQKVDADSLGAKILKTIALIYLVEQFEKLPPIVDIISDAFCDSVSDIGTINEALVELIEKDCIVYLKRSNNYLKIKESSGVDIPAEVVGFIENNRATLSVKKILDDSSFDSFMYPTRYNDEYEIIRYFDFKFIDSSDFFEVENWEKRINNINADGVVYAIIPKNDTEIKKLRSALLKLSNDAQRVVFILPNKHFDISKLAFEYEAIKTLRSTVVDDELLLDEYDIYFDDLTEVIGSYINTFVRPENNKSTYYYCGKKCPIHRRSQLSEQLSQICEQTFNKTPIINNESINKNLLPAVAINSRTKILAGLLSNELAPNLGLIGTGQDVSIMRSVLVQTGVFEDSDTNPVLNLKPKDKNLKAMLAVICKFFDASNIRSGNNFKILYDELTLPNNKIGLKRGLIPIFIAVVLHSYKKNIVIKCKEEEVRITPDLLNEINETPDDYSIILDDWSEEKAAYLNGLERIFAENISDREKSYNGFAFIVLAMNRWYMNLPRYAKELKEQYVGNGKKPKALDTQRKKFINSMKQLNNNPREYLLETVFSIFKMEFSPTILDIIKATKSEWDNAVSDLIKILIVDVKEIFAINQEKATLSSVIRDWYETLSDNTLQHLFTNNENRILELMAAVPNDESTFVQRLGKAVTSLRIEDWSSDTIKSFIEELKLFKKTIDEYNKQKTTKKTSSNNVYRLTFIDETGNEITKSFGREKYSKKAVLLRNELFEAIEEMGQSITEQEKRQVLMELLENLC